MIGHMCRDPRCRHTESHVALLIHQEDELREVILDILWPKIIQTSLYDDKGCLSSGARLKLVGWAALDSVSVLSHLNA